MKGLEILKKKENETTSCVVDRPSLLHQSCNSPNLPPKTPLAALRMRFETYRKGKHLNIINIASNSLWRRKLCHLLALWAIG